MATEQSRKAVNGWRQILSGEKTPNKKNDINEQKNEDVYKPGEEESSSEVSIKKLMESHKKMQNKESQTMIFNGTADLIALKLVQLLENNSKIELLSAEESGVNTYKIKYIV